MKRSILKATLIGCTLLFGVPAKALIINVSEILITPSALNTDGWLQVSEVIASESGTGNDLALASAGATATGSSNWPGTVGPSATIDGVTPPAAALLEMFHSNENDHTSFLKITLAAPSALDSITIFGTNQHDLACCTHRDIYNLELRDASGNLLYSASDIDATSGSVTNTLNAVPLPASVWLLGTGIFALLGIGRRKQG